MSYLPIGSNLHRSLNLYLPEDFAALESAVRWEPASAGGTWVFSDSDLNGNCRLDAYAVSNVARSAGNRYFEFQLLVKTASYPTSVRHDVGMTYTYPPSNISMLRTQGIAISMAGGIYSNSILVGSGPVINVGDVMRFAVNFTTLTAWLAVNAGAWIGGGDPSAGTLPTIAGITAQTYRLGGEYESAGINNNTYRMQGNNALFAYPPPAGFVSWGA